MSEIIHDDVEYEPRDVRIMPIVWFLVFLFALLLVVMVALWWTQNYLVAREEAIKQPTNTLTPLGQHQLPPEPRIEGVGLEKASHSVTRTDLPTSVAAIRANEAAVLKNGWTDSAGGKHPPIDDAMRRVVAKFGGRK